jgi:hypothetical protein
VRSARCSRFRRSETRDAEGTSGGGHQQYLDDPSRLGAAETLQDGNGILGHIFGSKDVSRQVAAQASANTGISPDGLMGMLGKFLR